MNVKIKTKAYYDKFRQCYILRNKEYGIVAFGPTKKATKKQFKQLINSLLKLEI